MTEGLFTRLYLWLVAHRKSVLVGTLLAAAICLVISSRMDLDEDILATLPQHDQMVNDYKYSLRKFRQIDRVYVDVGQSTGTVDSEALGHAADEVYAGLATNKSFLRIAYRIEFGSQHKAVDYLTRALPNLFTASDEALLARKIEPDSIGEHLTDMRRRLAGPEGMTLKDVVAADPVGMSSVVLAKVLPLQTQFGDAHIEDGRLVSSDGRHVLLMAEPNFASSNSRQSKTLVDQILHVAREIERDHPGIHVAVTGGHRMTVDNAALITSDASRCMSLAMASMIILCFTVYRRRWLAALTFLPSVFGTLAAGVVLALGWRHLSAIATGFATIAIGITVDYAIYVIYHLDNAAGLTRAATGRHLSRLVMPITVGALTTIAGFLVMTSSPMPGYKQLAAFGAIGVLFSAAFSMLVLPLLVPIPKQGGQPPLWLTRWLENFHVWRARRMKWILPVLLALTVLGIAGVHRLRFEGDITKLNGITEPTRRDNELIEKTWGEAFGMTLVVARGKTPEDALEQNDRAAKVLAANPHVKGFYSLSAICPSRASQEANLERWDAFWTPTRRDSLRQTLQKSGADLGFRPDAFEGFWQHLDKRPDFLTLDYFRDTPLEQAVSERVAIGAGDNAVSTMVKLENRDQVEQLRKELGGLIVLDGHAFARHIAGLAKEGLKRFALWTTLFVAVIVYIAIGSIELVAATLLPLAVGLLWTFGAMGWLGLPIDIMNSVFVIFIISIGEDYSVFLMSSKLDEWRGHPARLGATSASVLISALTTICGFAVLVFARHPVLFSMGTTVLLGMTSAFTATFLLTPLCMDLLLFREQPCGAPRWWHPLGTLWVVAHLGGSQIFLYGILRPWLKIFSPRTADDKLRRATRCMARGVVKCMPFGRLEFQDISPETFAKPAIVISNHQSAVDVMLVVSLPGDVRQTAKKRVFDNPMLGIGCKLLGHVMVEPNRPDITIQRCRERLAEGALVHFYPEGTRSPDGSLQRFHRGAFELAAGLRQEILPIILCDTCTAVPRDAYWFEPYHAVVRALPRVTPENFDYSRGAVALTQHCEKMVRDALETELDRLNTPRVLRRKVERLYRYQGKFVEQLAHWKLRIDPMFAPLDRAAPRRGFILDLGCGYGLATHWLAHAGQERTFLGVDYDETKIRAASRTAPGHRRVRFISGDILEWDYPACDAALLLDVLHYWPPDKQQLILNKVRGALRPGGRLVLRDAANAKTAGHRHVARWERFATGIGHNKTREGLHFQSLEEIEAMLKRAGFARCELIREAGRGSNVLLVASVEAG